jgi:hypothetical protein
MGKRYRITLAIVLISIAAVVGWQALSRRKQEPVYQEPGSQVNGVRSASNALGTNEFSLLLHKLKANRGSGAFYVKVYRAMPKLIRAQLPYPMFGDDIKLRTLIRIGEVLKEMNKAQLHGITREEFHALGDCVASLRNPRLKMDGLILLRVQYESDPLWYKAGWLQTCKKFLNDSDLGIQLEAAINMANAAFPANPNEPRLFPILLGALDGKQRRKANLDLLQGWNFQPPPGAPANPAKTATNRGGVDMDHNLESRVWTALQRIKRFLTEEQRDRLSKARPEHYEP